MTAVIRLQRADAEHDRLTDDVIALIKGMLARGDRQSDIAACFLINGGRIAEINHGKRGADAVAAKPDDLPPPGPYPSPYQLWKTRQAAWRVRVALENAERALHEAIIAVHKVER
jgi:hypothetical protein